LCQLCGRGTWCTLLALLDLPQFFLRYRAAYVAAGLPEPEPEAVALLVDLLLCCLAEEPGPEGPDALQEPRSLRH